MTVSSTTAKNTYPGDGSDVTFDFTFPILDETHLSVQLKDANGDFTEQALTTHYTVSGTGNTTGQTDYTSGTVTFLTAPAATETVVILRGIPIKQETDYVENETFPAETHEAALDKLTMICQQIGERADRSITFPDDSTVTDITLPEPSGNADKYLKYNSAGTAIEVVTLSSSAGLGAVSDDAAPVLGGDLTVGSNTLTVSTNLVLIEDTATVGAGLALREGTDNGSNFLALKAPDSITTSVTFELPDGDGTAGQILKTDGSGNLDWVNNAAGMSNVVEDVTPQLGGDLDVNGNNIVSTSNGTIEIRPNGTGNFEWYSNNTIIGGSQSSEQAKLSLFEASTNGSNYVRIQTPASLSNTWTLTLPDDDGDSGETLITNGGGVTSWGTPDIVGDTSPQLGGNLDLNGNSIVTTSNGNINLSPNGTGSIIATAQRLSIGYGASGGGSIRFLEDTDSGSNYVDLTAGNSLSGDTTATLPNTTTTLAGLAVDQTWTGSQRTTVTTDNDGSLDMNAAQDFTITPTGAFTLEFTNEASGQSGMIYLNNGSNHTCTLGAEVEAPTGAATALSATGTYLISYWCYDGTNVAISFVEVS